MEKKRIAFIGSGNMAEAVIAGTLAAGLFQAEEIVASDPSSDRRLRIEKVYGIRAISDNREATRWGDFIFLGVKPRVSEKVLSEIRPELAGKVLVSVVAGVPLSRLTSGVERGVIRAMPNAPARVRYGATALATGPGGTAPEDLSFAHRIFEAVGKVWTLDEKDLDAVTGLSGSGPAYMALVIDALADGGVKCGLSREIALALATQTALGAAQMLAVSGVHPAQLRDEVASPGGTTIAGLHVLENHRIRAALIGAVEAATHRAIALGQIASSET